MMRRLLPCLCLALFCASASLAQNREYPKWDFTAAFTFNRLQTPTTPTTHQNLYGFTAAVGANFKKYFALEGDVTYTTKTISGTSTNLFTYLVGPRFTKRITLGGGGGATRHNHADPQGGADSSKKRLEPFVHALFGGGHLNGFQTGAGTSTNGWAGKFGGGLDIVVSKHVAIRVVQVDYYRYHGHLPVGTIFPRQRLNNVALTFGIRFF
jgi:Outer membrane protein beta-barrel domain